MNAVQTSVPAGVIQSANVITAQDRVGLTGLSDNQWHTLVTMLNKKKQHPTSASLTGMCFLNSWIVDSGATNHMTSDLSFLCDVRDIAPLPVKLPDGRFSYPSKQGSVSISSTLVLRNVLLVDGLHCHLISVSQLTRDSQSVFQITDKLCLIQDAD